MYEYSRSVVPQQLVHLCACLSLPASPRALAGVILGPATVSARGGGASQSARSARGPRSIKAQSPPPEPVAGDNFEASPNVEAAAAEEEEPAYQIRCPMALLSYRSAPTYRVSPVHCLTGPAQV